MAPSAARRSATTGPKPPPTPAIAMTRSSSMWNIFSIKLQILLVRHFSVCLSCHDCPMELRQANPRRQGDIGEGIAAAWLMQEGYGVWVPFGHSPDCDLLAQKESKLLRIQVKTSTLFR